MFVKDGFFTGVGFFFFFNERNIKLCSDIIFAVVPEKSLKVEYSSYHTLWSSSLWEDEDWGKNSLSLSNLLGLSAQSKAPESKYSKAANALFCFLFASYWFNQLDFRSPNNGWWQECIISRSGPTETTYYILRSRPDILYAGHGLVVCKEHADVFFLSILQVRKIALSINSISLFQAGFYSRLSDTMCWYKEHFYSDHILPSLC